MSKPLELLGNTIRELRKNLELTQEQLGEMCERHPVYISELERGIKNPSMDSILRLCKTLEVTPGELMDLVFRPDEKDKAIKKQIATITSQFDSEDLKGLLVMIEAYKKTRQP